MSRGNPVGTSLQPYGAKPKVMNIDRGIGFLFIFFFVIKMIFLNVFEFYIASLSQDIICLNDLRVILFAYIILLTILVIQDLRQTMPIVGLKKNDH